jgi:hypothetical protein
MRRILLITVILVALPAMAFAATKTSDMIVIGTVLAAGDVLCELV